MTDDEITEGNELIAEFGGLPRYFYLEELEYHSSWDWLIPVVHKVQEIDEGIGELEITTPIEEVFSKVVRTIKNYNRSKGKNNEH